MLCFSLADITNIALFADRDYRKPLTDRQFKLQGPTLPNTLPITDINSGLADTTSYQRGSAIKRFNGIGGDGSFTNDKYPGVPKPMTINETIVKKPRRSIPVAPPPPPRPKMLATIKVRMKNGKIILRRDEINTVENIFKTKPSTGSNVASDLKNRPGALALRPSTTAVRIEPPMLLAKDVIANPRAGNAVASMATAVENKAATAVKSLETAAARGGGGRKAAAIGLGLVAGAGGIGYLINRQRNKN